MEDIKSPVIMNFVKTAGRFCELLEQASQKRTGELIHEIQELLPEIYTKGARLPLPRYCYDEEPTTFVKEDDYAMIHTALQEKFELFTGITGMSPGTLPNQHELVSFGLAEGIADIYEELKNFVKLYEIGLPQTSNDSVWFCRKSFENRLGPGIIDSLKSLHSLIYSKNSTGSRAIQDDDFNRDSDEEPWYSDDQEQVYGDDE